MSRCSGASHAAMCLRGAVHTFKWRPTSCACPAAPQPAQRPHHTWAGTGTSEPTSTQHQAACTEGRHVAQAAPLPQPYFCTRAYTHRALLASPVRAQGQPKVCVGHCVVAAGPCSAHASATARVPASQALIMPGRLHAQDIEHAAAHARMHSHAHAHTTHTRGCTHRGA